MIQKLSKQIENEMAKKTTDEQTFQLVQSFWKIDVDVPAEMVDRIDDLSQRMNQQHGWKI